MYKPLSCSVCFGSALPARGCRRAPPCAAPAAWRRFVTSSCPSAAKCRAPSSRARRSPPINRWTRGVGCFFSFLVKEFPSTSEVVGGPPDAYRREPSREISGSAAAVESPRQSSFGASHGAGGIAVLLEMRAGCCAAWPTSALDRHRDRPRPTVPLLVHRDSWSAAHRLAHFRAGAGKADPVRSRARDPAGTTAPPASG